MMLSDKDVYRTATVMIDLHGDDAEIEAAKKADQFLDEGDVEGSLTWARIALYVAEITDTRVPSVVH